MRVHLRRTVLVAVAAASQLGLSTESASADWAAVELKPAGTNQSLALGGQGSQQVGIARVGSASRASLWNGSAASWLDLTPSGADQSAALEIDGGQQVGYVIIGGLTRASMWSSSAGSWVNLNPAPALRSQLHDARNGQQVGAAVVEGVYGASLWHGSAASWVSLHPAGASQSDAQATDGVQQGGYAIFGGGIARASLWSGSAASWVDLSGGRFSEVRGIDGGQQAGVALVGGRNHASLWSGTAASWVDLADAGISTSSNANDVDAGQQVGGGNGPATGFRHHAMLWNGTPGSRIDLHVYLPAHFSESDASAIWRDGDTIYVAGSALNSSTGQLEAVMWINAPPPPPDTDSDGLLDIDETDIYFTDPNDPDTDDDGLLDGTEVDMAQGTGCPDPLNPDSDGDTLSDGAEVALGTSPCDSDSDGDGIPDDIDPLPLDPEGTGAYLEDSLRTLCDFIHSRPLSEFDAPNNNAARGRQNAMCNKVMAAANAVADENFESAIDGLSSLLDKLDDQPEPPDWMHPLSARDEIRDEIENAIAILLFM